MNNYFYKVHKFDSIDSKKLNEEFMRVAAKHDLFDRTRKIVRETNNWPADETYYRLMICYPEFSDENLDPLLCKGYKRNLSFTVSNFNVNNIVKDFQGTYTEEVTKLVHGYLTNRYTNYSISGIKYHALAPRCSLELHRDGGSSIPRFFLIASVLEGCYMQINDEKIPMHEEGSLFRLNCSVLHNPVNETDGYRICIVFDVSPK